MMFIIFLLAILYIALAVLLIAFSLVVFLGRKKIKKAIEKIKSRSRIKIEIKVVEKSHI